MSGKSSELTGRRVFVVEDEWLVSILLRDTLVAIGCEVAGSATRYKEAAEKAETLAFDVAILDINLDGERTYPIAESLAARGIALVFATGYDFEALPEPFHNAPILQKPFRQSDLERALREALEPY
ncbi:MAG: response regulator [Gammaproteobacteria bacterium]|nr:response regulator [Gammaproteobacteria bacterium]